MNLWPFSEKRNRSAKAEARSSLENPSTPLSFEMFAASGVSSSGVNVTIDAALGVPAVWAAVNFLSSTIASLPLSVYKKTDAGREKGDELLNSILHDATSDGQTSFDWRKYSMEHLHRARHSHR